MLLIPSWHQTKRKQCNGLQDTKQKITYKSLISHQMACKTIGIHYPVMQLILVIVSFLCLCVKKAEKITKFQLYGIVYFCYQFYHIIRFFFYYLVGMIFNQAIPRRFCDENLSKKSQYILLRRYMEEKNMVSLVLPL